MVRARGIVASCALVLLALTGCVPPPPSAQPPPGSAIGPANMASHGVLITAEGVARTPAATATPVPSVAHGDATPVVVVVDPMCSFCGQFVRTNAAYLLGELERGAITVEVHPVAILDARSAGTDYSTRAVNAIAAVADEFPDAAPAFIVALFDAQPAEGSSGLDDEALIALAAQSGASSQRLADRIRGETFRPFVELSTDRAFGSVVPGSQVVPTGTPTVVVGGEQYQAGLTDAEAFAAFVESR